MQALEQVLGAQGFATRANAARQAFEERGGPVPSQSWLAKRASSYLEGDEIGQSVIARWLNGENIPDTPIRAWAFAQALNVDPGWLMFGGESGAPAPESSRPPLDSPAPGPPLPRSAKPEQRKA